MEKVESGSVQDDLRLVAKIEEGNPRAWEFFVDAYTGWALYRAGKWCGEHCRYKGSGVACGLIAVSRRMEGENPGAREECDEGMDTYIWIMEQLRKRTTRFTGKNNSRLGTFVWTVLNSKELYVDWLRWKYGRVF